MLGFSAAVAIVDWFGLWTGAGGSRDPPGDERGLSPESGAPAQPREERSGTRSALVVAQVALAFVLLAGSGLLTASFAKLLKVNPGFQAQNVITARFSCRGAATGKAIVRGPSYESAGGDARDPWGGERRGHHPIYRSRAAITPTCYSSMVTFWGPASCLRCRRGIPLIPAI